MEKLLIFLIFIFMYTIGIIPARIGSTRLPRKMLLPINGKPLIYWTWKQVMKAKQLDKVVIATDSEEIFDVVEKFGGEAVMTSPDCVSGSDRVAEAAKKISWAKLVINIQGDEPFISPSAIDAVVKALKSDPAVPVATAAIYTTDKETVEDVTNAKIALDKNQNALYFSRSVIPFSRNKCERYLKHVGIYGFQRAFLFKFTKLPPTFLEKTESLEQLRILEHGYKIKVAIGKFTSISVDTAADLARVRKMMKNF